jgi:hypothetical protein
VLESILLGNIDKVVENILAVYLFLQNRREYIAKKSSSIQTSNIKIHGG